MRLVSPGYLATLAVPLRGGRDFAEADIRGTEPVAVVNEAFAQHFWPGASPLDRSVQIGHYRDHWINPRLTYQTRVIGVVADIREAGLDRKPKPTVLLPRRPGSDRTPLLLVRGSPRELVATIRGMVSAEDSQLAPVVEPLSNLWGPPQQRPVKIRRRMFVSSKMTAEPCVALAPHVNG